MALTATQDNYTKLYNKFLTDGQSPLNAYVDENGRTHYGTTDPSSVSNSTSSTSATNQATTNSNSSVAAPTLKKPKPDTNSGPNEVQNGPGAAGENVGTTSTNEHGSISMNPTSGAIGTVAADQNVQTSTPATAQNIMNAARGLMNPLAHLARSVISMEMNKNNEIDPIGPAQSNMGINPNSDPNDLSPTGPQMDLGLTPDTLSQVDPGSNMSDTGGVGGVGTGNNTAGVAGVGVAGSGVAGDQGSDAWAEGGPVGLMDKESMQMPQQEAPGEAEPELKNLVDQLKAGKMDVNTFVQEVVKMVEPAPEATPAMPMGGGEGLMSPQGPAMAQGGEVKTQAGTVKELPPYQMPKDTDSVQPNVQQQSKETKRYAEGGGIMDAPQPQIPPDQQVQGTVADPAVDKSDTVDVNTDQGQNAKLTSGEFVFPSDAARFIGHEKLMKMVQDARQKMGATTPQIKEQAPAPEQGQGLMNKPMAPPMNTQAPKPAQATTGLLSVPPGLADRIGQIH